MTGRGKDTGLQARWRDFLISRALRKRGWKRSEDWILIRRRDGHMFAPGSPQNFAYAMRGLFVRGRECFHFYRVREWHGLLVASRKVFWNPQSLAEFAFAFKCPRFDLPPLPEVIECAKLDAEDAA
jgi:hypothetical protein